MYYLPKSNTPSSFIFVVHFIIYHDINVINMAMNIDVIYPIWLLGNCTNLFKAASTSKGCNI